MEKTRVEMKVLKEMASTWWKRSRRGEEAAVEDRGVEPCGKSVPADAMVVGSWQNVQDARTRG